MTEAQIQAAIIKWRNDMMKTDWRLQLLFAVKNEVRVGGKRGRVAGARNKADGVVPGIPDLLLAYQDEGGGAYYDRALGDHTCDCKGGLFIEVKTPGGKLSAAQKKMHFLLKTAGYRVEVCRSAQEAIDTIREYLEG